MHNWLSHCEFTWIELGKEIMWTYFHNLVLTFICSVHAIHALQYWNITAWSWYYSYPLSEKQKANAGKYAHDDSVVRVRAHPDVITHARHAQCSISPFCSPYHHYVLMVWFILSPRTMHSECGPAFTPSKPMKALKIQCVLKWFTGTYMCIIIF